VRKERAAMRKGRGEEEEKRVKERGESRERKKRKEGVERRIKMKGRA
jgi:hypothetical protein